MIETSLLYALRAEMEYNDHPAIIRQMHNMHIDPSVVMDAIDKLHPGMQSSNSLFGEEARKAFDEENHSLVITNWEIDIKDSQSYKLIELIRDIFSAQGEQPIVGSHLYISKAQGGGFAPHFDNCTNLIFQLDGVSKVIVYGNKAGHFIHTKELNIHPEEFNKKRDFELSQNILIEEELHPGDCLYIPYKQYHCIESLTDRISLSVPFAPTDLVLGHRYVRQ